MANPEMNRRAFLQGTVGVGMNEAIKAIFPPPPNKDLLRQPDYVKAERELLPWGIYGQEGIRFDAPYTLAVPKETLRLAGIRTDTDMQFGFQPEIQTGEDFDKATEERMKAYMKHPNINRVIRSSIPGLNVIEGHSQIVYGRRIANMPDGYPLGWMPMEWLAKANPIDLVGAEIVFKQADKTIPMTFTAVHDEAASIYQTAFGAGRRKSFEAYVDGRAPGTLMPIPSVYLQPDKVGFAAEEIDQAHLILDTCNGRYNPSQREYSQVRFALLKTL